MVVVELLHQRKAEIISSLQRKDSTVERAEVMKSALCLKSSLFSAESSLDQLLYLAFFIYKIKFITSKGVAR